MEIRNAREIEDIFIAGPRFNDLKGTLRSLGAQVVVALSHLGWKSNPFYLGDDTLAAKTSGIDLIIGGHSHSDCIDTVANKEGMPVLITQAASQGRILGRVDIMLKKE